MTHQTSARQFMRKCQTLCAQQLPGWKKHRTYGLYRRTEDFVQWVIFDPSIYESSLRTHYSIQALAEQFPVEALTLGAIVQNSQGGELRLMPELNSQEMEQIITSIVAQIEPLVSIAFSAESIAKFLDARHFDHVSALVARGISAIAQRNEEYGRSLFRAALEQYNQMRAPWARPLEAHVQRWLEATDEDILYQLRHDALVGAALLHLK